MVLAGAMARAGDLVVDLGKSAGGSLVGAVQRWDEDGKPRVPVDPKAKIEDPRVDARAVSQGSGRWVFRNLPAGHYDLVILASEKIRVEGFRYPPINEFDPFLARRCQGPRGRDARLDRQAYRQVAALREQGRSALPGRGREASADPGPARPRQADQLRRRLRRSGGHGAARGLAVHQQLRRLGEGPQDRSPGPDPHGPERIPDAGPGSGSPGWEESRSARNPSPSLTSYPRSSTPTRQKAGSRTEMPGGDQPFQGPFSTPWRPTDETRPPAACSRSRAPAAKPRRKCWVRRDASRSARAASRTTSSLTTCIFVRLPRSEPETRAPASCAAAGRLPCDAGARQPPPAPPRSENRQRACPWALRGPIELVVHSPSVIPSPFPSAPQLLIREIGDSSLISTAVLTQTTV